MENRVERIYGLDLIRGICAVLVCLYHVVSWSGGPGLYTWGTYGVYIFFAVSGASLYIGYSGRLDNKNALKRFFARRYFRLAPLYIGAVLFSLLIALAVKTELPQLWKVLLNFSLLFGFTGAGATSLITGGWSIGIEVVFYVLFPVLLIVVNSRYWLFALAATFILQHTYIAYILNDAPSLAIAWNTYTQPVSFIFYFMAGMCIAKIVKQGAIPKSRLYGFSICAAFTFMLLITGPDTQSTLIGPSGWLLSLIAVFITFFACGLKMEKRGKYISDVLGKASYGLYLIHPFTYLITKKLIPSSTDYPWLIAASTIIISSAIALVVDRHYEHPTRRWLEFKFLKPAPAAA